MLLLYHNNYSDTIDLRLDETKKGCLYHMKLQKEKYVDKYIMNALFTLMKKKKYEDISITDITNKAGVGRVSFYRNFNTKEDIIRTWIYNVTEEFLTNSNISYEKDTLEDYFIKLFTHLEKFKIETILIYKANLFHLLKDEFDNRLTTIYKNKYTDYKSYFIAGGIFNVYYYWLKNGCVETPNEIANKLINLMQK